MTTASPATASFGFFATTLEERSRAQAGQLTADYADASLPRLIFRLPGTWWPVPLDDRERARASIKGLVRRQVGISDDRARLRDELASTSPLGPRGVHRRRRPELPRRVADRAADPDPGLDLGDAPAAGDHARGRHLAHGCHARAGAGPRTRATRRLDHRSPVRDEGFGCTCACIGARRLRDRRVPTRSRTSHWMR